MDICRLLLESAVLRFALFSFIIPCLFVAFSCYLVSFQYQSYLTSLSNNLFLHILSHYSDMSHRGTGLTSYVSTPGPKEKQEITVEPQLCIYRFHPAGVSVWCIQPCFPIPHKPNLVFCANNHDKRENHAPGHKSLAHSKIYGSFTNFWDCLATLDAHILL